MTKFWPAVCCLALLTTADAHGATSFSPESIRVFVWSIDIRGPKGGGYLYQCKEAFGWFDGPLESPFSTPPPPPSVEVFESCFIDLLDDDDLQNKLGQTSVELEPGIYEKLHIDRCFPRVTEIPSLVKGKVEIDGETWYTQPGEKPLTKDSSKYGYARLVNNNAPCFRTVTFKSPVTIKKQQTVSLDLYFVLENAAIATTAPVSGTNCSDFPDYSSLGLCINSDLDLFPVETETPVEVESFLIFPSPTSDVSGDFPVAQVDFILDENRVALGASVNYFFSSTPPRLTTKGHWWEARVLDGCLGGLQETATGYRFGLGHCYGPIASDEYRLIFDDFQLENHLGTVLFQDYYSFELVATTYRAVRTP